MFRDNSNDQSLATLKTSILETLLFCRARPPGAYACVQIKIAARMKIHAALKIMRWSPRPQSNRHLVAAGSPFKCAASYAARWALTDLKTNLALDHEVWSVLGVVLVDIVAEDGEDASVLL